MCALSVSRSLSSFNISHHRKHESSRHEHANKCQIGVNRTNVKMLSARVNWMCIHDHFIVCVFLLLPSLSLSLSLSISPCSALYAWAATLCLLYASLLIRIYFRARRNSQFQLKYVNSNYFVGCWMKNHTNRNAVFIFKATKNLPGNENRTQMVANQAAKKERQLNGK